MAKTEVLNLGLADSVILCDTRTDLFKTTDLPLYLNHKTLFEQQNSTVQKNILDCNSLIISPVSQEKRFTTWIGFSAIYSVCR